VDSICLEREKRKEEEDDEDEEEEEEEEGEEEEESPLSICCFSIARQQAVLVLRCLLLRSMTMSLFWKHPIVRA
jgi:hypothetical protein